MHAKGMFGVVGALLLTASAAGAQSTSCPGGAPASSAQVTQDACQQAVDVFQYMAPLLSTAIAGGNATLGQGGILGGFGHFSLGVRANVVDGTLPQVDQFNTRITGAGPAQTLPTKSNQPLPMPVVDAAIGVWNGLPLGVTNVLGLDLLLNVSYIPEVNQNSLSVNTPNGSLKFGYGARVGIVKESIVVPGVAVTYLKRDLPTVTLAGTSNGAAFNVSNADIGTTAWRVVASKHFIVFGLAAGIGQDKYSTSASVQGSASGQQSAVISLSQDMTRTNMFADLSLNFPILKLVGEVGQVSGGSVATYNAFANKDANASRLYGSVGLRFAW
ncbi:MAG: hypothetical protein ACRENQ_08165 [Gemmatimonadaceae bacterium]